MSDYDHTKLSDEKRALFEKIIGPALLYAKTWARTDADYNAAKTGAYRAVFGLINNGYIK